MLLLSCSITLFTWMVSPLKGWNSWVFLSSPSMVSAMLHAFWKTRSPVYNGVFCIFKLFGPHTNHSHTAWFKCSPYLQWTADLFKANTLSNFKSFQVVMLLQYLKNVSKIDLYTSSPTSVRKIAGLLFATNCLAVALFQNGKQEEGKAFHRYCNMNQTIHQL